MCVKERITTYGKGNRKGIQKTYKSDLAKRDKRVCLSPVSVPWTCMVLKIGSLAENSILGGLGSLSLYGFIILKEPKRDILVHKKSVLKDLTILLFESRFYLYICKIR